MSGAARGALRVSVVIPCYNAAAFLREAVASVRAQTHPVAEVIAVDDASSDDTVAVARALGLTVVTQPVNSGPSPARNVGVTRATGDVVAFLDADDAWFPWHLDLCVGALDAHPRAAVACTESTDWGAPPPPPPVRPHSEVPEDATVTLLHDPFVPQSAAVARRSAVIEVGGYDERRRYAEDYDLWLRLASRHDIVRVRAPGLRRRPHPGQASRAIRRMVESGFELRLRTLRAIQVGPDRGRAERAEVCFAEALDADLHATWYVRDADAFDSLLALSAEVPGPVATVRRRWRIRRQFGWHLWDAGKAAKRLLSGYAVTPQTQ